MRPQSISSWRWGGSRHDTPACALPEITLVGETDTLAEARNWLATHACDLVFLDIQLWGGTGFDLVPLILSEARIIFVTAFDNYAVRAFEVNALDYLIKPVRRWHPRVSHPTIWFISRPAKARRGLSPCPPSPRSKPAKIIPQCSSVTARGSWCDAR
jgi:hypothetical protein